MSEIPIPKIDPIPFEMKRSHLKGDRRIHDFGTSAVGGALMDSSYHRPGFYEAEKYRGTKLVGMDAGSEIDVPAGEDGRIATFGLAGCSAVAVSAEMPDGTRKGYIQHYSPLNRQLGVSTLAETSSRLISEGASNVRAVVMVPGEWTQDPEAKWAMKPKDHLLAGLMSTTIQSRLGEYTDVQIYPYSENMSRDQYGQGTLMVEFRDDGTTQILAETMPIKPDSDSA